MCSAGFTHRVDDHIHALTADEHTFDHMSVIGVILVHGITRLLLLVAQIAQAFGVVLVAGGARALRGALGRDESFDLLLTAHEIVSLAHSQHGSARLDSNRLKIKKMGTLWCPCAPLCWVVGYCRLVEIRSGWPKPRK